MKEHIEIDATKTSSKGTTRDMVFPVNLKTQGAQPFRPEGLGNKRRDRQQTNKEEIEKSIYNNGEFDPGSG